MKKRLNFWYGSIFGTYWMIYGITSSFASVFLLAKGYSNSQIGLTLAAANILAVILQPLVADIADRSSRIGSIGISAIMGVMMMIFVLGQVFLRAGSLAMCVSIVLLIGWHTVLQPMFNSLTFNLEETGIPINFGIARSVGSLAYSLLVALTGTLVENLGVMVLPAAAEVTCAMMLVSLFFTRKCFDAAMRTKREGGGAEGAKATDELDLSAGETETCTVENGKDDPNTDSDMGEEDQEKIGLVLFAKRHRLFFILNLGVVGVFFSNSVLNNYMLQIVTNIGGTSEDMGRILGLMAFLEIPAMVLFSRIKSRFSCRLLLKVASIGFTMKILLHWLASSVSMLFVAQLFQLIGFGLFFPAMVYFIGEHMSRGEAVKGQALFTTMITASTIFATLLGGWILDVSGARTLTLIATLATVAGGIVVFAIVDRIGDGTDDNIGKGPEDKVSDDIDEVM